MNTPYCEFQMSGLCGGESCGFKPWTVLEGCFLSFVLLRSVEISCFRGKKKQLVKRHDLKKKKSSPTSRKSLMKEGFSFDFHYLNSRPT